MCLLISNHRLYADGNELFVSVFHFLYILIAHLTHLANIHVGRQSIRTFPVELYLWKFPRKYPSHIPPTIILLRTFPRNRSSFVILFKLFIILLSITEI